MDPELSSVFKKKKIFFSPIHISKGHVTPNFSLAITIKVTLKNKQWI